MWIQMNNLAYKPFFSIVIANYNYGRFLEDAISSLLEQSCQDFELIIVDGGSSDNSVDIINKYRHRLAWWCSEKDRGQSHAFNKGFAKAKGLFLTWLNADDMLTPGTLAAAKRKLLKHPECRWMTGNGFRFTEDGKVVECRWGPWCMPSIFQGACAPVAVFGPTSFFSRSLFQQVGGMNESLHYVMDTDLWIRFIMAGESYIRLNHVCWAFRMHDLSKTAEYGSHLLEKSVRDKLQGELTMCFERHAYHYSKLKHALQFLWRVATLSEVKSKVMAARWQGRDMGAFIAANCVEN